MSKTSSTTYYTAGESLSFVLWCRHSFSKLHTQGWTSCSLEIPSVGILLFLYTWSWSLSTFRLQYEISSWIEHGIWCIECSSDWQVELFYSPFISDAASGLGPSVSMTMPTCDSSTEYVIDNPCICPAQEKHLFDQCQFKLVLSQLWLQASSEPKPSRDLSPTNVN